MYNNVPITGEADKKEKKPKISRYDHQTIVNQLLSMIADSKMSDILKMILRMRIWGIDPAKFHPLNYHQIAFVMVKDGYFDKSIDPEVAADKVKRYEQEALSYMNATLAKKDIKEVVDKVKRDNKIREILNISNSVKTII